VGGISEELDLISQRMALPCEIIDLQKDVFIKKKGAHIEEQNLNFFHFFSLGSFY